MIDSLKRLMLAEAATPADALALAVAARTLMRIPLSDVPPIEEDSAGLALHCIDGLLNRTIQALESSTGICAATFTGEADAVN